MLEEYKGKFNIVFASIDDELKNIARFTKNLTDDIGVLEKDRDDLGVAPYKILSNPIYLDVGGMFYTSTFETLTAVPDSLIGRMFSGRYPVEVNDDGRVFIDRDGTYFGYVLKFLREPSKNVKMSDKEEYEEFKTEIEFYGLTKAMFGDVNTSIPERLDWIDNNIIKVYSFSSQHTSGSFPASNTLNPSTTYWLSETGQTTNQWIVYEFPTVTYINKIMIKVDNFECTAKDSMIQVCDYDDPNGEWRTVKEFQVQCGNSNYYDQYFEGFELRARYVRLFYKNNWGPGGGQFILVTNIKFFGGSLGE